LYFSAATSRGILLQKDKQQNNPRTRAAIRVMRTVSGEPCWTS
jgi:hypothetical protein